MLRNIDVLAATRERGEEEFLEANISALDRLNRIIHRYFLFTKRCEIHGKGAFSYLNERIHKNIFLNFTRFRMFSIHIFIAQSMVSHNI